MKSPLLPLFWIGAVASVAAIGMSFESSSEQFLGVAEHVEKPVRFEYPVVVEYIAVSAGEIVTPGQLLASFKRPEIDARMTQIDNTVRSLEAELLIEKNRLKTSGAEVSMHFQQDRARIDLELAELSQTEAVNRRLIQTLSSREFPIARKNLKDNPRVANLLRQKDMLGRSYRDQKKHIDSQIQSVEDSFHSRIANLKAEYDQLVSDHRELKIHATETERVGTVSYRDGEIVDAWQPVLTLHSVSAGNIDGYIHESLASSIRPGDQVFIVSSSHKERTAAGTVVALGGKVVPYPERLLRNRLLKAWGRQVSIKLNEQSPFLLGEKVSISAKGIEMDQSLLRQLSTLYQNFIASIRS